MPQTLADWDVTTAPALQKLEIDATWVTFYTRSIEEAVDKLEAVPEWDTLALAAIHEARAKLLAALVSLDRSIMKYGSVGTVR